MRKKRSCAVLLFWVATAAGTALHFAYSSFPNVLTALFAPVNESIWEHVKLVYWPMLFAVLFATRPTPDQRPLRLWALLLQCAALLLFGYVYDVLLCGGSTAVHIVSYILIMAAGFFLLPALLRATPLARWPDLPRLLTIVLGVAIVLFTFLPPEGILFVDLRGANVWTTIPY